MVVKVKPKVKPGQKTTVCLTLKATSDCNDISTCHSMENLSFYKCAEFQVIRTVRSTDLWIFGKIIKFKMAENIILFSL